MGADGVNPIEFLVLVGDADRQWLESHYFDNSIVPIGKVRVIIPARPDDPDSLQDACVAFCPRRFSACMSLAEVQSDLTGVDRLDFHLGQSEIPASWFRLREEARSTFSTMNIWQADLQPLRPYEW